MGKSRKQRRVEKKRDLARRRALRKKVNDMGDLIDMSQEMFEGYIDSKGYNIGKLKLLHQNFSAIYFDLNAKKDALVEQAKLLEESDRKKHIDLLNRMFLVMQKIEYKCAFLLKRIDELDDRFREELGSN